MKRTKLLAKKGFRRKTQDEILEARLLRVRRQIDRQVRSYNAPKIAKITPRLHLKRGSMVKPIPLKMRHELAEDPFMQECCIRSFDCKGRIEFHHNLIYAGKRVNEYGAILPLCHFHHEKESKFKRELNAIMYSRMTDKDRAKYPRKKWQ